MQITKAVSAVADPEQPSLLTSIPPEIRNAIYEVLFKRDEPILLHNTEAYHAVEPRREHYKSKDQFKLDQVAFHGSYEREIGASQEFQHDLGDSIFLLLSCRQVYHEASGILYSDNSFVVSRALDRHDRWDRAYPNGHASFYGSASFYGKAGDYFEVSYAPQWLLSLGSQQSLLRKVVIDVDAICPDMCSYDMVELDVLPLMRLLWSLPAMEHVVTFGRNGRTLTLHRSSALGNLPVALSIHISGIERPSVDTMVLLNNILKALAVQDILNIRRYAYSTRLLNRVVITRGHEDGYVEFGEGGQESVESLDFLISGNGTAIAPISKDESRQQLKNLPRHIQHHIYDYVYSSNNGITYNLDNETMHGFDMRPFQFDRILRHGASLLESVRRTNDISFEMTSTESPATFDHFRSWHKFWQQCFSWPETTLFHDLVTWGDLGRKYKPLTVSMEFVLETYATLSDIRIDIRDLIFSFPYFHRPHSHSNIMLRFKLNCPRKSGRFVEETSVSLAKLQKELFLLLSDFLIGREGDMLPHVWIDGRGKILYAEPSSVWTDFTQRYSFKYGKLTRAEVLQLGQIRGSILEKTFNEYNLYRNRTTRREEYLLPICSDLYDMQKPGWASGGV